MDCCKFAKTELSLFSCWSIQEKQGEFSCLLDFYYQKFIDPPHVEQYFYTIGLVFYLRLSRKFELFVSNV